MDCLEFVSIRRFLHWTKKKFEQRRLVLGKQWLRINLYKLGAKWAEERRERSLYRGMESSKLYLERRDMPFSKLYDVWDRNLKFKYNLHNWFSANRISSILLLWSYGERFCIDKKPGVSYNTKLDFFTISMVQHLTHTEK